MERATAAGARDSALELMQRALSVQQARRLDEAASLYRQALALDADIPDALHMLGVIRYERKDYAEALDLMLRALDLTGWRIPAFRHNLGLVLARSNAEDAAKPELALREAYREWVAARSASRRPVAPRVSVVVPCYNHARFVAAALASVYAQTYRDIELVVIDDGSADGTAAIARATLQRSPFPFHFDARENRGAPRTIEEGIAIATGAYVNVLNSDDVFAPERIARMVDEVAGVGADWGFAGVHFIDAGGAPIDLLNDSRAYALACVHASTTFASTVGFALISANVAVSTGNLFVSREFVERLGGFRPLRYNHDWDFCLRAVLASEPVFVDEPLYGYRLHEANTIGESSTAPRDEANGVVSEFLHAAGSQATPGAPFAPARANWGTHFVVAVLEGGLGELMDAATLRQVATQAQDVWAESPAA